MILIRFGHSFLSSSLIRKGFYFALVMNLLSSCALQPRKGAAELVSSPISTWNDPPFTATISNQASIVYPTLTTTPLPTKDLKTATPLPEIEICSPLASTTLEALTEIISDGFHPPPQGQDGRHQGVDFAYYRKFGRASIADETVQAVISGRIAASIEDRFPYGNVVIVETTHELLPVWVRERLEIGEDKSLYILYAHLNERYPKKIGEMIAGCQAIGTVGMSGNAGVAHLHLEVRIGKSAQVFSSMAYYLADATPEERQTYLWWRTSGEFVAIDPMLILKKSD